MERKLSLINNKRNHTPVNQVGTVSLNILNGSRRKRIALGSGTQVQDVNRLLKQFEEARKMMKRMQGLRGGKGGFPGMPKLPFM